LFLWVLIWIGLLNVLTLAFHLYSAIFSFDMVMHFSGGFFVSIGALTVLTCNRTDFSYGQLLFWAVSTALIIGLLWELFELYFGITYLYSPDYIGDNGMDVTMDIAGGFMCAVYSYYKLKQ